MVKREFGIFRNVNFEGTMDTINVSRQMTANVGCFSLADVNRLAKKLTGWLPKPYS